MTPPDSERWSETTSGRERVRMVLELLDAPRTVSEIADAADVAWATADSELARLTTENRVAEHDMDGQTKYGPNLVQMFLDQVIDLIQEHSRDELEGQLLKYQEELEELQADHDADSAEEFRERLAAGELSGAEMREIRSIAATWEAVETERRLTKQALHLYEDVTRFSDRQDTSGVTFA